MIRTTALAVILLPVLLAGSSQAQVPQWAPEGIGVCSNPCLPARPLIIPDPAGGSYVAWEDARTFLTTDDDIYIQRLTGSGEPFPGWPSSGLPVCVAPRMQILSGLASDGVGGALLIWQDFRNSEVDMYCQRVLPDGTTASGWTVNGVNASLDPGFQGFCSSVTFDGAGGAYVVWEDRRSGRDEIIDVYLQRITADGQIASGWPLDGLLLTPAPGFQTILPGAESLAPDGQGGAVVVWHDCVSGTCDSYAQRILSDGTIAPGWPSGGLRLFAESGRRNPRLLPDGTGGFFVSVGTNGEPGYEDDRFVQRIALDGSVHPGWPAGGVQVCCTGLGRATWPRVSQDGAGGMLLVRSDDTPVGRDLFAFRVGPDGSLPPGWPFDGNLVNDPTSPLNTATGVVPDGEGGAFYSWEWDPPDASSRVRVQHLSSTGIPKPNWPAGGIDATSTRTQFSPQIAPDGAGGVVVVWEEVGGTGSRRGIFAQRFVDDEEVSTRPSLMSAEAVESGIALRWYAREARLLEASVYRRTESAPWKYLGVPEATGPDELQYDDGDVTLGTSYAYRLGYFDGGTESFTEEVWVEAAAPLSFGLDGFRPHPAVGLPIVYFTLAKPEPARLEVFDPRGRLVLRRDLSGLGVGRHSVSLGDARFATGVYILRLTQGNQVAHTRGVIID